MEIRLARAQDIDGWMMLVEQVRDASPGLETAEAMEEHRATVLNFIQNSAAVCAKERDAYWARCCSRRKTACSAFWRWIRPIAGSTLPGSWCI